MAEEENCIFCAIANGRAPASILFRDESVVAFLDRYPRNPGHTLVIPAAHYVGLADLPEPTGARMFNLAQRVAGAIRRSGLPCEGISLRLADGTAAGQEVWHCHLHVIPRVFGDARRPPQSPTRDELEAVRDRLRRAWQ